jgi:SRSO17 transposase
VEDSLFPSISVEELALGLPKRSWRRIKWREGTAEHLSSRFARLRVRVAHRDYALTESWPESEEKPAKYWLSTLPKNITFRKLVDLTKLRWRIEQLAAQAGCSAGGLPSTRFSAKLPA